jgi:hypothetical protein
MPNPDKKEAVIKLQEAHKSFIAMDEDVIRRAKEFDRNFVLNLLTLCILHRQKKPRPVFSLLRMTCSSNSHRR